MKIQLEIKWTIFLLVTLITSFGLLTGFKFNDSLDIQMHDTYYVILNTHYLLFSGLILMTAYFLTLSLKRLAIMNGAMKIASTLITGIAALIFSALTILTAVTLLTTSIAGGYLSSYGLIILVLGIGILFVMKTIEIYQIE